MGMPVTIEVVDSHATLQDFEQVFDCFVAIDERFSTYKESSEISLINNGALPEEEWSNDMKEIMVACEKTKLETHGFFDIAHNGLLDPSGYVKGWAIQQGATLLQKAGFQNYYVEIAGDLQVAGYNSEGQPWVIGIRNPFNGEEVIKRVALENKGMATSGTYIRGQHVYNPHNASEKLTDIVSLTVIGPAIVDADRYATAAFAMGAEGISFIASLPDFEGYQIDAKKMATFTPGFNQYVLS